MLKISLHFLLYKKVLLSSGYCTEILKKIDDTYHQALQTLVWKLENTKDLSIVYTPLHGSGLIPAMRAYFPTVSYPKPEERASFNMAMKLGQQVGADLLLATDPDAD
ncbi:hypothetical protein [Lysinibacillus sp. NPDC047702]|uniref:hypothetical protein n=1 Tax=unclassified Lysinibacillus TaxID=2636778 RepID=UPI003D040594